MQYKFDVIIIGAGPAGVTAAGVLAGSGLSVALLESGIYAGAENWSGCVYFTESLAEPDCFGHDKVEAAPFERRVLKRGTLMHNGLDLIGIEAADAEIFKNCYTVLRPIYDPYFANLCRLKGAVHLTETTVTSLLRKQGRVVGVQTNRGSLLADVTFIAEGDASHLVRSEGFERSPAPHYFQGVKAVLSLEPKEIEKRFGLNPGDGAAYEFLIRNPLIAGRTAKLNIGGFLYTNRDSLSLGYVLPLDNLRNSYRGSHDTLFEWVRGLPYIKELTLNAALSAYGTKIIRSGGWRERPVLIEDGLAVGGASTGLGVDIPFPNFTGPASATGLYFGRAVKNILLRGRTPGAKNLLTEYLIPLQESVYGRNARYLSRWPGYFGRTNVLFSRTVDVACGSARFLSRHSLIDTGRFLRRHILSSRGIKELIMDTSRAIGSLALWKPVFRSVLRPSMIRQWISNTIRKEPDRDPKLRIIASIDNKEIDATSVPWPVGPLIRRAWPLILSAVQEIYANDRRPAEKKFATAAEILLRGLSLADLFVLPAFGLTLFLIALGTAVWDAFRFYVLRVPAEKFLREPVMIYNELQRKARDLDAVRPVHSFDTKLATNTYRIGPISHIRTLWPASIPMQPEMSNTGLWWVCPAKVYLYDVPAFAGRGKVMVNYENCIKCESCWRAEPARTLWGRHTEHKLIYRPESTMLVPLIESLKTLPSDKREAEKTPEIVEERLYYLNCDIVASSRSVLNAASAFSESIAALPASADKARLSWPIALGGRLKEKLRKLESAFMNDGRHEQGKHIESERKELEQRLSEGRLFHALYCSRRIEQRLRQWAGTGEEEGIDRPSSTNKKNGLSPDKVSKLFPDRIVKEWEDMPMPEEWAGKLRNFIAEHRGTPLDAIRALSSVSPALGMLASRQLEAIEILAGSEFVPEPGISAVDGSLLEIRETGEEVEIKGTLNLVPLAATKTLLILFNGKGFLLPLSSPGITITPTPAIGFRAARLSDVSFNCVIKKQMVRIEEPERLRNSGAFYLAIALGAGDYLCRRIKEHAAGRIQFPGQMLDTEGRDGIAKFGAVKAMIARTEAWKLLLQTLYEAINLSSPARGEDKSEGAGASHSELALLCSSVAAAAFSPEPGTMGYDAGQVFGGFAYSEDDLLSRFYRDSSLFRFLAPGYDAASKLNAVLNRHDIGRAFPVLGTLDSLREEPLVHFASRLISITEMCSALSPEVDPALAGEAKGLIISIRALLASIEEKLNRGRSMEAETAAAEVLLGMAETGVKKAEMSAGSGKVLPTAVFPVEPVGNKPASDIDYERFCTTEGTPHKSGRFLFTAFDRSPRFVPEMQLLDSGLRTRWADLAGWFKRNCRDRKFDGLPIERFIEKIHRLPDDIIAAAKEHKWLATYIPQSVDGLGWRKAEYYILNAAAGAFGDAAIDLLIMASTSIGTTPILLGLDDELPRVREELAPLVENEKKLGEIGSRLAAIIRTLSNPNPGWIRKEYEAVMKLVDERIRRTRVVKYLAANFLRSFYAAGIAGKRGDFGTFISNLKHAGELFSNILPDVRAALDELPRRESCHKLFLRYLGHGGVSAFALTEPTAGSDSAGVKTTAKLLTAKLIRLDDGRYSFYLNGNDEKNLRYLIDSEKIVFVGRVAAYETPDGQSQPIMYDKYDYSTDSGFRYYVYNNKECAFHDIGQVRNSADGFMYEYYSLSGAKMWITNGSIATQFCLYAQTPEGVTGFMVNRHAEGLKVGADEKKTGQRGSPTNEIAIDNVRVPREAVIGYEGHGQVNALETLNVGRCGLAVVSGALMRKLMQEALGAVPQSEERDRLLGEAAAILFGSESLAYYLVGLFDRPHESVRMESAIAKYVCSEDIHELLTLVERAFGPSGQTEKFLVEKARRDSRILTIYEGTNEVQRFLILKDLIAQASGWPEIPEDGENSARMPAIWKNKLRGHVKAAARLLGDTCWSDAMLQPALFPLSEMAGEILRLDCIYYRMEWLKAREYLLSQISPAYAEEMLGAAERATERTMSRLEYLNRKYIAAWEHIKNNMDMPEVHAADAALDQLSEKRSPIPANQSFLRAPMRILSVVRPVADLSTHPRITDGEIQELVWRIDSSDLAALSQMLEIKTGVNREIVLDVLMPGGPEHDALLRSAAGLRADALRRLAVNPAASPEIFAKAVRDLETLKPYDIIITGAECLNGEQGLGPYLAGSLKRLHYRREQIEIKEDGTSLKDIALPAVISITTAAKEHPTNINQLIGSAFSHISVTGLASTRSASSPHFELPANIASVARTSTDVTEAAAYLKTAASASGIAVPHYRGNIVPGSMNGSNAVWSLLDPQEQKSNLASLRAGRLVADLMGKKANAVIAVPRDLWSHLVGMAEANGCEQAYCIDTGNGRPSNEGKRALIREILKTSGSMIMIGGAEWKNTFAYMAGAENPGAEILTCSGITGIKKLDDGLAFTLPVYEGKLIRRYVFHNGSAFVAVSPESDFPLSAKKGDLRAFTLDMSLKPDWILPLSPVAPPTLSQADVIIDLGYGIRDRAGFELAQELKRKLETLGLSPMFGATRKVTQDLKLLPLDAQIGQTGVRVNPKLIIALGISGAPQHIDYIGTRADILCFNKDPEAPLMNLNRMRPAPRVHPILGDLFITVRELIEKLVR